MTIHVNVQNSAAQVQKIQQTDLILSVVELLRQQQALQRDPTVAISKVSDLLTQHNNDYFLVDVQIHDVKGENLS